MKVILALFVALSAIAIQAGVVPVPSQNKIAARESKGFKLLGSITKKVVVDGAELQEDWRYWESVNAAGWAQAAKDCRANGDTLLFMETREELKNVTRWLQDTDNSGSLYWVGGKYDSRADRFVWDNGVPLNPDYPWAAGEPRLKNPNTRVAAETIGREIEFKTQANTVNTRYICEGPWSEDEDGDPEKIPVPCFLDNDLVILIDASGSVGAPHFEIAREFTSRLASAWVDYLGSRVAVLTFESSVNPIFGLADDQSVPVIKQKIYDMPYTGGGTSTHLGIAAAIAEIQANHRDVIQSIVVLTDGASADKAATKAEADRAISLGMKTYSVGIGAGANQEELLDIAGGDPAKVFTKDDFNELLTVLRPLSEKICEE